MIQARLVAETLQRLDPDHAPDYDARLAELTAELAELDAWIDGTLGALPGTGLRRLPPLVGLLRRRLRSAPDRHRDRGQGTVRLPSSPGSRKTPGRSAISVVFVQPQIAGKSARAIAGVMGARLETLDPLAPDIIANLRHVTDVIVDGFDD